jgi:hypothetical protein
MAGLLDDMKAAQTAKARGAMSHRRFDPVTGRQMADAMQSMGLLASPIPVVGDVAGLLGDAAMYAAKPEERTMGNAALTALGVLPFFPSLAGKLGRAGRVLDVTDADTFRAVKAAMGGDRIPEGEIRQAVAQYNAALSKQAGGLGMDAGNTAAERSGLLGYDTPAFHGTLSNVPEFDMAKVGERFPGYSIGIHTTSSPREASMYAGKSITDRTVTEGANVMPLMIRKGNELTRNAPSWSAALEADTNRAEIIQQLLKAKQSGNPVDTVSVHRAKGDEWDTSNYIVRTPQNIRSKFAAFDPAQSNSRNLLASLAGVGLLSPAILASMRDERQ